MNANPASLPFLVVTSVEVLDGNGAAAIVYPEGQSFRPEFASTSLRVARSRFL